MRYPSDMEIETAIKALKQIIEAAENSNHAGEVALMNAYVAICPHTTFFIEKDPIYALNLVRDGVTKLACGLHYSFGPPWSCCQWSEALDAIDAALAKARDGSGAL